MHFIRQIALREFGKGGEKISLRGNLRASFPTADATQRFVGGKALDKRAGGRNAERGLGDEGPGQRAAILARTADPSRRFGNDSLAANHIENGDEPPEQASTT